MRRRYKNRDPTGRSYKGYEAGFFPQSNAPYAWQDGRSWQVWPTQRMVGGMRTYRYGGGMPIAPMGGVLSRWAENRHDRQDARHDERVKKAAARELHKRIKSGDLSHEELADLAANGVNSQGGAPSIPQGAFNPVAYNNADYAASAPGSNPFAPLPAQPPSNPPANARIRPIGGDAPVVPAKAGTFGVTGAPTLFTIETDDPFWLFDLVIQSDSLSSLVITSMNIGSTNLLSNSGIVSATTYSQDAFHQGKLSGFFLPVSQKLKINVASLDNAASHFAVITAYGSSVKQS